MSDRQPNPFVSRVVQFWTTHQAEVRLAIRMTAAALLSYGAGEALGLVQSYWAVLTSIIVMQGNLGGSIKSTVERLLGTIGGSFWGLAIILTAQHVWLPPIGLELALIIMPLALVVAFRPTLRVAPVTGVVLLLSATVNPHGPIVAAFDRTSEIALGCAISFVVSLLVFPARAHRQLAEVSGQALRYMADELDVLTAVLEGKSDGADLHMLRAKIRGSLSKLDGLSDEAERERSNHLSDGPDTQPLLRTLRRLRNDLVILSRAEGAAMMTGAPDSLGDEAAEAGRSAAALLRQLGIALASVAAPPPVDATVQRLRHYDKSLSLLRQCGETRALSDEALAQLFNLGFALTQMSGNIADLAERTSEFYRWRVPQPKTPAKEAT